jgi:dihydroneopterin aldolase
LDKIILKGMPFFAYHGNNPEENVLGQKFIVDTELFFDKLKLGKVDDLENTVDYSKVYAIIKEVIEETVSKTIEYVASSIAETILKEYDIIDEIKVLLKKPAAPVAGVFDWMGVEITRRNNNA